MCSKTHVGKIRNLSVDTWTHTHTLTKTKASSVEVMKEDVSLSANQQLETGKPKSQPNIC